MNPKIKKQVTFVLLAFVFVAVAVAVVKEMRKTDGTSPQEAAKASGVAVDTAKSKADRVVVYYFHGTARCPSCLKIEKYSDEAVHSAFKNEFDSGLMEWHVVNVEESGNGQYVEKYKLYTKSVVVSAVKNNSEVKWKLLDQTWNNLGDKDKFVSYVQSEVKEMIPLVRQ